MLLRKYLGNDGVVITHTNEISHELVLVHHEPRRVERQYLRREIQILSATVTHLSFSSASCSPMPSVLS
jgi:hypothetical protein